MAKFDPESWQRAVTIFRDAIRENPAFSPCYSSLVQMNNIEHFVHPGVLPRSRQGKSDPRTCEDRRSTGSGRFQGASVLWLVSCDGAPGGRGGAAYGTRLRVERQRSVDLAVLCALLRLLRIDRAGPAAGRSVAGSFAGALASRMGLPRHHSLPVRRLCRCSRSHAIARTTSSRILPAWRAAALFDLGRAGQGAGRGSAVPQRNTFVLGWIVRADRRGRDALGCCKLIRSA